MYNDCYTNVHEVISSPLKLRWKAMICVSSMYPRVQSGAVRCSEVLCACGVLCAVRRVVGCGTVLGCGPHLVISHLVPPESCSSLL